MVTVPPMDGTAAGGALRVTATAATDKKMARIRVLLQNLFG